MDSPNSITGTTRKYPDFTVTQTEGLLSLPQIQGRCRRAIVDDARR